MADAAPPADPWFQTLFADRLGGANYGKGTEIYKFEKIKRAKRKAVADHPERKLLDFGIGENDDMAPAAVREALKREADRVENRGYARVPLYLLYHINIGHPVVSPTSRLVSPAVRVEGWDEQSRTAEPEHATFHGPAADAAVEVFEHHLPADGPDEVTVAIVDPTHGPTDGLGVAVTYDRRQLPRLWQWRMLGEGLYLTGLEPANCGLLGRVEERRTGPRPTLEPGEVRPFGVQLRAVTGTEARALAEEAR
jgi:hypothetical protein